MGKKSNSNQGTTIYKEPKKLFANSWRIILFAVIVIIVIVAGYLFVQRDTLFGFNQCRGKATSPLYNEAADVIKQSTRTEYDALAEKIKKNKHYDSDSNCLYPLVAYDIFISDVDSAKSDFDKLKNSYDESRGFSKAYSKVNVSKLSDVKTSLDRLIENNANSGGHVILFN